MDNKAQVSVTRWGHYKLSAHRTFEQGKLDQSEQFWWLALREAEMADNSQMLSICLDGVADIYMKQNRTVEAENLYRESLREKVASLGLQHPLVAMAHNSVATAAQINGKYREAEELLTAALEIFRDTTGLTCPEARWSVNRLKNLKRQLGQQSDQSRAFERLSLEWISAAAFQPIEVVSAVCEICHKKYKGVQCLRCTQRTIETMRKLDFSKGNQPSAAK